MVSNDDQIYSGEISRLYEPKPYNLIRPYNMEIPQDVRLYLGHHAIASFCPSEYRVKLGGFERFKKDKFQSYKVHFALERRNGFFVTKPWVTEEEYNEALLHKKALEVEQYFSQARFFQLKDSCCGNTTTVYYPWNKNLANQYPVVEFSEILLFKKGNHVLVVDEFFFQTGEYSKIVKLMINLSAGDGYYYFHNGEWTRISEEEARSQFSHGLLLAS